MTFGWSYPAGVTGRELDIAGPDWEGVLAVDCENEDATLTCVTQEVAGLLTTLRDLRDADPEQIAYLGNRLHRLLGGEVTLLDVDVDMCPFSGKVDAWSHGGVTRWNCPVCGLVHEDEAQGEDPDEAYDRMRDERWETDHGC